MSSTFAADDERIDQLLQEFLAKRDAGEQIEVSAFAAQNAPYQQQLAELLPAFLVMERCATRLESSRHADDPPESLGEYRLRRLIGRGGMGLVFEAHHEPLDRRVALKLLSPWRAEAPLARERFLNEARAIAGLQHENLIPIFDVGSVGGYDYFAMQLIDGINGRDLVCLLRERSTTGPVSAADTTDPASNATKNDREECHERRDLDSKSPALPNPNTPEHWQFVARACMQSARALHHAHNAGVVHRDVKPSNILIDRSGKAWVSDFGLAKKPDSELTRSGVAMGTLRYMAPEQFRGETVDGRADIYGLGVTLFELLSLRDSAVPSTTQLVAQDGPPFLAEQQLDHVPAPLRDVVLRAAMPNAGRRYQNALEVAQDLENYLNHQPIRASGPTRRERIGWHLSRHRTTWLTVFAVFMLVMAMLGGVYVSNAPDRDFAMVNGQKLFTNGGDREVASWVIQEGGTVRIFDGYQQPPIKRVDDLPDRLFNVTTVDFWDYDGLEAEKFAEIAKLKRLDELLLNNCKFSEECIRQLPQIPLISLHLNACDVADKSLEYIAKLDRLVWLGLRDNDLSDEGVASLKPLLNLSEISLSGNSRLTNRCLRPFAGKNTLDLVDVRGTQVDGRAAEAYQSVIQRYDLGSKVLYGASVDNVTMHGNRLYPGGADREIACWVFQQGGVVTLLDKKGRMKISAEKDIPADLFNLTSISLTECDALTEEQIRRIVALPRLDELSLNHCTFNPAWLQILKQAPLIGLELRACGLTDAATADIASLEHICSLKLPFNQLSAEAAKSLAKLNMLTELDLRGNAQVSDRVFPLLASAQFTLQQIDVRGTRVTVDAAATLQSQLRKVDSKAKVLAGSITPR